MSEKQAPYYVPCPECKGSGKVPNKLGIASKALEYQHKLNICAGFDSERAAPALFEIIGVRKLAAQRLMKSTPGSSVENAYQDTIELMDEKIKQLLAL